MISFSTRLGFSFLALVCFVGLSAFIVNSVEYEPFGVPRSRRVEYETRLVEMASVAQGLKSGNGLVARAIVENSRHDFGMLDPHVTYDHDFIIRNDGDSPLVLESGGTSCKCTLSKISSHFVKPGESTVVTVEWNTGYEEELFEQTALIRSNDPVKKDIYLTISGKVKAELVVSSGELVLPSSEAGELASGSVYLYSQLWDDFIVESAVSELPGFQWSAEPITNAELPQGDLNAKSAWRLKLIAIANKPGPFSSKVHLKIAPTSGGVAVEREVLVGGKVKRPIAFVDPEISTEKGLEIGVVHCDSDFQRSLSVRCRSIGDRTVQVIDVMPKCLKAELVSTKNPGLFRLDISLASGAKPEAFDRGDKRGYVQVGDPNDKNYQNWLPIYGVLANAPRK